MAKVIGPLLSIGASGQIGKSQIYAKWRGVPYARRYAVPANPNTTEQQKTRDAFRILSQFFALAPATVAAAYQLAALGKAFTDRNKFVQTNLPAIRDVANMGGLLASPGARGGPAMQSMVISQDSTNVIATLTEGTLPTGWGVSAAYAIMFHDQPGTDPSFDSAIIGGQDSSTPFTVELARADFSGAVVVSGWMRYFKPDNTDALSIAFSQQYTIT